MLNETHGGFFSLPQCITYTILRPLAIITERLVPCSGLLKVRMNLGMCVIFSIVEIHTSEHLRLPPGREGERLSGTRTYRTAMSILVVLGTKSRDWYHEEVLTHTWHFRVTQRTRCRYVMLPLYDVW